MMKTYRGIVCEKNKNDIIFMTANGEFLHGTPLLPNPEIGDEVEFYIVTTALPIKKRNKFFIYTPVVVAAVLMIFIMTSIFSNPQSAYAYIQLKGDHSIELGINEKGKIISAQTLDKSSINQEDWQGLTVHAALTKAVNELSSNKKKIEITTEYEKDDPSEIKNQIEKAVKEIKTKNSNQFNKTNESTNNNEPKALKTVEKQVKKESKSFTKQVIDPPKSIEKQIEIQPSLSAEEKQKNQRPIEQPKKNHIDIKQMHPEENKKTNHHHRDNQEQRKNENRSSSHIDKFNKNHSMYDDKKHHTTSPSHQDSGLNK